MMSQKHFFYQENFLSYFQKVLKGRKELKDEMPDSVEFVPMFWGSNSITDEEIVRIKTLADAGRIKYANINVEGMLQLESGEHDFEVFLSSRENVELSIPYEFKIESKFMVPPIMIISDFAISND